MPAPALFDITCCRGNSATDATLQGRPAGGALDAQATAAGDLLAARGKTCIAWCSLI
jgi:hypothetical protein